MLRRYAEIVLKSVAVKINLHELLLENRHEAVETGDSGLQRKNCVESMEESQPQP